MTYDSRDVRPRDPYYSWLSPIRGMGGENIFDHRYQNIPALPATGGDPVVGGVPQLGSLAGTEDGKVFQYVQMTGGAAALGTVLERAAVVEEETVSSSADLMKIETGGVTTTWVAGAFIGDYVWVDAGTGAGQTRRIVDNTTVALTLDRPLATALAVADSDIWIIRPFRVIAATAAILTPVAGVSVGVITEDYFGWAQVGGICEHVLIDNATATVGSQLVVDDGVAGKAQAITDVTLAVQNVFGIALATAASTTIPVKLTITV